MNLTDREERAWAHYCNKAAASTGDWWQLPQSVRDQMLAETAGPIYESSPGDRIEGHVEPFEHKLILGQRSSQIELWVRQALEAGKRLAVNEQFDGNVLRLEAILLEPGVDAPAGRKWTIYRSAPKDA